MIVDLDAHLVDKSACQISWCLELFSPPLSQTLAKPHGVSLLTKLSELKFDHRFRFPFDIQPCMPTFTTLWAILTFFKPYPSEIAWWCFTFEKFIRIKFDHRFGWTFDKQVCMWNFATFQNIFTPFKPNLSKNCTVEFHFWLIS